MIAVQHGINKQHGRNKILKKHYQVFRFHLYISIQGNTYRQQGYYHNKRCGIFRPGQPFSPDLKNQVSQSKKCHYQKKGYSINAGKRSQFTFGNKQYRNA